MGAYIDSSPMVWVSVLSLALSALQSHMYIYSCCVTYANVNAF